MFTTTKLEKAVANLILDNCFFATLLFNLEFVEDRTKQTFATDGERIYVNPDFLETLTVAEVQFVLAHEVLHCVFQHCLRLGEKEPERWNYATDYIINGMLAKETGVGAMPKGGLLDDALVNKGGGTDVGVYNLLPSKPKGQPPKGGGTRPGNGPTGPGGGPGGKPGKGQPGPLDELLQPTKDGKPVDEAGKRELEAEWKRRVAQAKQAGKMRGQLSPNMEKLAEDCLKPKVDWKQVLRRFVSEKAKTDLSYAKPKRRFLGEDIYLPSLTGEKIGSVVVAVDCSGSVGPTELREFSAEIRGIFEDTVPKEITVIYFDAHVLKTDVFNEENKFEGLEDHGGGGTDFAPIFEKVNELEVPPVCVVVLTDLCCNSFGESPSMPVLWVSTALETAPFGEITMLPKGVKGGKQ